jgi:hypothetical protein
MDSPGKPLIVDRFEDQAQLYFTEELLISLCIIRSVPFYMDSFGRCLGEEHECGISQKRPPDWLSMSSFTFLKILPYMATVQLSPLTVMNF